MAKHMAAVQRRDGNQVEGRENDVDEHEFEEEFRGEGQSGIRTHALEVSCQPGDYSVSRDGGKRDATEQEESDGGDDEIADGAGDRGQDVIEHRVAKVPGVYGRGFGPS